MVNFFCGVSVSHPWPTHYPISERGGMAASPISAKTKRKRTENHPLTAQGIHFHCWACARCQLLHVVQPSLGVLAECMQRRKCMRVRCPATAPPLSPFLKGRMIQIARCASARSSFDCALPAFSFAYISAFSRTMKHAPLHFPTSTRTYM